MKVIDENDGCFSTIILAGGRSSRMEFPKPWLPIDNITFLEKIITTFHGLGIKNISVVMNQLFCSEKWKEKIDLINDRATIVENSRVYEGRLYSIKLALENSSNSKYTFICNVDNPFVNDSLIRQLQLNANADGATIPSFNHMGGHPIIINKAIREEIINNYKNHLSLKSLLSGFDKKYVDVKNPTVLTNINTKEDYLLSLL